MVLYIAYMSLQPQWWAPQADVTPIEDTINLFPRYMYGWPAEMYIIVDHTTPEGKSHAGWAVIDQLGIIFNTIAWSFLLGISALPWWTVRRIERWLNDRRADA